VCLPTPRPGLRVASPYDARTRVGVGPGLTESLLAQAARANTDCFLLAFICSLSHDLRGRDSDPRPASPGSNDRSRSRSPPCSVVKAAASRGVRALTLQA